LILFIVKQKNYMMKKFFVFICLIGLYSVSIFAQSDQVVITWPMVVAEAKKTDEQIAHPRKSQKSRIWVDRGRKHVELYAFDLKQAYPHMKESDIIHIMKTTAQDKKTVGDTTIYSFPRIDLYFANGKLINYERTDEALEFFPSKTAPLDTAKRAYFHARKIDDGKRYDDIAEKLSVLTGLYTNEAYYYIYNQDYEGALPYYAKIADILSSGYDNNSDSVRASLLNDCAVIAHLAKDYDKAISYYTQSIEKGNNTIDAYGGVMSCQKLNQDTAAAISTIKTIIETFPEDSAVIDYISELVNLYLGMKQYDEALAFLNKAIEKDPTNTNFLLNVAILHETSGNIDEAIKYYKKTLELDPNNVGANANMALLYSGQAREILIEAEAAYGTPKYKSLQSKGKERLKKAIPYYESYIKYETDEISIIKACTDLMSIYSQLRMEDDYERIKKIKESLEQ
jgi:tetratricopeptide (TPR) repeat protein